jgi:serine/threonine protein kinase
MSSAMELASSVLQCLLKRRDLRFDGSERDVSTEKPMLGRSLSHYEILEKLGAGSMDVVYRARVTTLGRDVAIKLLPPEIQHHP